jgi:hypothetical protein
MLFASGVSSIGDEFFERTAFAFGLEKLSYNSSALSFKKLHG